MSLQITTTRVMIQINIIDGKMSICQPRGEQNIHTTMPKVRIEFEKPKVIIDQYQCFAEAGLKNYLDLTKEAARFGYQKVLEGIARIAEDGDRMAQIENGMPPAIPELAEKNAWEELDYNIDFIPKSRPKIDVEGRLKIDWELGKVNIDYKVNKPIINFQRGKVEIYLKQKPSIKIRYIDVKI
ncbi:hypothetical protein SAMN02745135_01724 [Caloranaerobacter azorensis DSM 13643]|uniref:Uncharacterized protein n=1 Tax=Caloranaerobacter azorensis DSM 13643 TaxID=1121264 RepID=A0A1M5V3J2_9FIRM|nr:DUF6470 family protein [Caloranaerobacter azorensis]SHH69849.1 hypothetical protein SAMN02745135_01724 [Caloranaerobacter azorensis DSM 13643]